MMLTTQLQQEKDVFRLVLEDKALLEDGVRNLMFAVYDDKDPYEVVRDFLIGHTSTGTKVDRVRHLVNDLEWSVTEE